MNKKNKENYMKNNMKKRLLMFLFGCVVTRLFLVFFIKNNPKYLKFYSIIAFIISLGFMYVYLTNNKSTEVVTFGDDVWWHSIRPIHSFFYLCFAILAFNNNKNSWIILLIDIIFGLSMFLKFHYSKGNLYYLCS